VDDRLCGVLIGDVLDEPVVVLDAVLAGFERIRAQIEDLGDAPRSSSFFKSWPT